MDPASDGDIVALLADAVDAITTLGSIDATTADAQVLDQLVAGVEQLRRMTDAAATDAAAIVDARNPFRSQGYMNARTYLKQRAQLSGPEAHRRLQTAHMRDRLPEWSNAARSGTVGVAQSEAMARVTANTHIDAEVLERDAGMLLDDAINAALVDHIRRVVYDSSGTIIELGRRSRLFRGSSRDAVMLLLTTCVWIGCDQPVAWCDADHSLGWKAHGPTVPRNGQPLCNGHQHLKETGFQVYRDNHGHWHIIDPHGNEIT